MSPDDPDHLHDDELHISVDLARRLLAGTAYAGLRVRRLPRSGSSNALFRLGPDLLLRLPGQPGGSSSIIKEARWLPRLDLPTATPRIEFVGDPGADYPEHWSVVRWISGVPPVAGAGGPGLARDLASVLRRLRAEVVVREALEDQALHWYRAEPMTGIDDDVREAIAACRALPGLDLDLDAAARLWAEASALPGIADPGWLHGDLLSENLLVENDRLTAVLDFGTLSVGDPTVDLIVAWEVLDGDGRQAFRAELDTDDAAWLRGRAWAIAVAVITLPYYWHTMPGRIHDRLVMARAALAG